MVGALLGRSPVMPAVGMFYHTKGDRVLGWRTGDGSHALQHAQRAPYKQIDRQRLREREGEREEREGREREKRDTLNTSDAADEHTRLILSSQRQYHIKIEPINYTNTDE